MSGKITVDDSTIKQAIDNYRQTALATEDGNKTSVLSSFSYAGGSSTYSFGLYQFDVGNNELARGALEKLGFSEDQINSLSQNGGLSASTINAYNQQLQEAISTPLGQSVINDLESSWQQNIISSFQSQLDGATDDIKNAILSDPVAIQRMLDIDNQFSAHTLNNFSDFLAGVSVQQSKGVAQWNNQLSASDNMQNWFGMTSFGASAAGIQRSTAFYNVVNGELLSKTVIDIQTDQNGNFVTLNNTNNVIANVPSGVTVHLTGNSSGDEFNINGTGSVISNTVTGENSYTCSVNGEPGSTATITGDAQITCTPGSGSSVLNVKSDDATVSVNTGSSVNVIGNNNDIIGGIATNVSIVGNSNVFQGSPSDNVTINGTQNTGFLDNTSTGDVWGINNNILGGKSLSYYDNNNALTDFKMNNFDGSSTDVSYDNVGGNWISVSSTYTGINETGVLHDVLTNYSDGTSTDTTYNTQGGSWISTTNNYSGKNDTGKNISSVVNNKDGTSSETTYNFSGTGSWFSITSTYSDNNATGTLTGTTIDDSLGTSQHITFNTTDAQWNAIIGNYTGLDGTGSLTQQLTNFSNVSGGTSYQPVGSSWVSPGTTLNFGNATITIPNTLSLPQFSDEVIQGISTSSLMNNDAANMLNNDVTQVNQSLINAAQHSLTSDLPAAVNDSMSTILGQVNAEFPSWQDSVPTSVLSSMSGFVDYTGFGEYDNGSWNYGNSGSDTDGDNGSWGADGDDDDQADGGYGGGVNENGDPKQPGGTGDDGGDDGGDGGDGDPLVLSLNHQTIQLIPLNLSHAIVTIDGQTSLSGWIGADTGVMALLNNDDSVSILSPGTVPGSTSALAALITFDANQDGIIDSKDPVFSRLRVLVDPTGNGTASAQSLTLTELGIQSIELKSSPLSVTASGNVISAVATVVFSDGTIEPLENVTFAHTSSVSGSQWSSTVNPVWSSASALLSAVFSSSSYSILNNGSLPDGWQASNAYSQAKDLATQTEARIIDRVTASRSGNGISLGTSAHAAVAGSDSGILLTTQNNVSLNGSNYAVETSGHGSTIVDNAGNNYFAILGANNTLQVNAQHDTIIFNSMGNIFSGNGSTLFLKNNSQAIVTGVNDIIAAGDGDQLVVNGTNNDIKQEGNFSSVTANNNSEQILLVGNDNNLSALGDNDIIVADGRNNTIAMSTDSLFMVDDSLVVLSSTGGMVRMGNGDNLVATGNSLTVAINGVDSQATITGDSNNFIASGSSLALVINGNSSELTAEATGSYLSTNGSNNRLLTEGNGNTININGSNNTAFLSGTGDSISIANGSVVVADNSSLTINGIVNNVTVGNKDDVTINGGNFTVALEGDNSALTTNGDNEQILIAGNNNTVIANGQGNSVEVSGINDTFSTSSGTVVLSDAGQMVVNGNGNAVLIGSADTLTVNGSLSRLTVQGNASLITANGDGQAIFTAGADNAVTVNGSQAVVTFSGDSNMVTTNGNNAWMEIKGDSNVVQANGQGALVMLTGKNNSATTGGGTIAVTDDSSATIYGINDTVTLGNRNNLTVNGGDFAIVAIGNSSMVNTNGDREIITVKGSDNSFTQNGGGSYIVVSGDHDSFTANGDGNTLGIHGNGNVTWANGHGDKIVLDGISVDIHTSGNTINIAGYSQGWINGGGDSVNLGDQDNFSVNGSGFAINLNGTDSTVTVQGDWNNSWIKGDHNTLTTNGNSNHISTIGSNDIISITGTDGVATLQGTADIVNMESGSVNLTDKSQVTVNGHGNIIIAGNSDNLIVNGGNNWVDAQNQDSVDLNGSGNGAGFTGTGGLLNVNGVGQYATMSGGTTSMGEGSSLQLLGSHDTINAGQYSTITLSGSGNTVNTGSSSLILQDISTTTTSDHTGFEIKGFAYTSNADGQMASTTSQQSLAALQSTGANSVQLVVTQYLDSITSSTIAPDEATESDADLEIAIGESQADGLSVMLKPHIDITDGTWRALLQPDNIAEFFANYKTFILHYAAIAQATHVGMFCVGCEMSSLSGSAYQGYWDDIISAVRQVYTGPLTYASAWNETGNVSFWDKVDVIGANAYEAPTSITDPTVAQMVAGWNSVSVDSYTASLFNNLSPIDFYHALSTTYDKPVILTETGYRSVNGTNTLNGDWSGFHWVDFQQQSQALESFFEAWSGQGSWMEGAYLWNWEANPSGVTADDFSVQNKPAEAVVDNWYGGTSTNSMTTPDTLNGSLVSVTMGMGNALVANGDNNTFNLAGNDALTLNGNGDQISVSGVNNLIQANGLASVSLDNTGAAAMVEGYGEKIDISGKQAAVAIAGDGAHVTLTGQDETLVLSGSYGAVLVASDGASVSTTGTGNQITVAGNGTAIMTSGGANVTLTAGNIALSVTGDGNTLDDAASGNTLTVAGSGLTVLDDNTGSLTLSLSGNAQGDVVSFGLGISAEQLWFSREGNDLLAQVIGTAQQVDINGWYSDASHQAAFKTSDGQMLASTQLDNLINAMASMTPPAAGQTALSSSQLMQLEPAITAAWH